MKKLTTVHSKGENYSADVIKDDDGSIFFVGDFDVDWDGSPNWHKDPTGQPETALTHNGKPIDSERVAGIVLPKEARKLGKILGCKATASYKGKTIPCVVFDIGPSRKLGEGSVKLAQLLGINTHPVKGGTSRQEITYRFWPGIAAVLDGVTYKLR